MAHEQAIFRVWRGMNEHNFNLLLLCEKYTDHKNKLHHNFIDFIKVFDMVWHEELRAIMRRYIISKVLLITLLSEPFPRIYIVRTFGSLPGNDVYWW